MPIANKFIIEVFIQSFYSDYIYPQSHDEQQVIEKRVFQLLDRRYDTENLHLYLSEGSDDIS